MAAEGRAHSKTMFIRGIDGKQIELGSTSTHLQWRYVGETTWYILIALSEITGPEGNNSVDVGTSTNITGLLKGVAGALQQAIAGVDYPALNDARFSDNRTPTDVSVSYSKVASTLKAKATVTSSIDLSQAGIGAITLTANTAFSFSGYELNKSYLLIITANGFTPSFATAARHVAVVGNAAFGTTGVFYVNLLCIDATAGSEKLLTTIMKGA